MAYNKSKRIKIGTRQALALLLPYIKDRVMSQIKSVWLIILSLVFFQTIILRIAIFEASVIAISIGLIVLGFLATLEAPRDRILCRQPVNGYNYLGYRFQFGASVSYLIYNFDKRILII